jgi:transcriptional regulator with XRE-family HTH domain
MSTKEMSLASWIEREGVEDVAKALGVDKSTVWHWRRGYCLPTAAKRERIVKLSRGTVTVSRMLDDYWSDENKKNRNQDKR